MKMIRTKMGYTQKALGERIGVSQVYISRIENGDIEGLTIGKLVKLANALQIRPEQLLTRLLSIAKAPRLWKNRCFCII